MGLLKIEEFIGNIKQATDPVVCCKFEKEYIDHNYTSLGSRKTAYSAYRKGLKESDLNNELKNTGLNILKLSLKETKKYKKAYQIKIGKEQDNLKLIQDHIGYIAEAVKLLDSKNYILQVLGFAALTGRRVAEIGCTAKFNLVDCKTLFFGGQLKTKESDNNDPYNIPVLTHSFTLISKFKKFRTSYKKFIDQPKIFHDNNSKDLSLQVKRHFSKYVEGNIMPKDLRSIYSTIACVTRKDNKRQTDQRYTAIILGHNEDDLSTCNSYFDYKMKD